MRRTVHLARRRRGGARLDERGVALVLTLLVVALLSAMILDFDFRTRLDVRAAANFRDDTRAFLLAGSAVDAARAILAEDDRPDHDGFDELWATEMNDVPVADGTISVKVSDETGKLDLNTLLAQPDEPDEKRVAIYRRLLEQVVDTEQTDVDDLVDALIDWLDEGYDERPRGAESNYYAGLDPPYECRNGPLRGLGELALVRGYTPDVMDRLAPHVTAIWEGEAATAHAAGAARHDRVNINTASIELLQALDPSIDESLAERIDDDRRDTPFTAVGATDLEKVIGLDVETAQRVAPLVTTRSDYFTVKASAKVGDTRRTVRATVHRTRSSGGKGGSRSGQVIAWRME